MTNSRLRFRLTRDEPRNVREILALPLVILGLLLVAAAAVIDEITPNNTPENVAGILGVILALTGLGFQLSRREERFTDVDRQLRSSDSLQVRIDRLEELLTEAGKEVPAPAAAVPEEPLSFSGYFEALKSVLEAKADAADHKASILLDKGVSYSRWGIAFYILSIIAWQALALRYGFQTQFIYGIASCSLLFIFIEFLAAWFLQQYRHFVETSTYLMKVKSIFDRYMLTFLAHDDERMRSADSPAATALLAMLQADIKWPDAIQPDGNMTREFMASLAELTQAARQGKSGGNA